MKKQFGISLLGMILLLSYHQVTHAQTIETEQSVTSSTTSDELQSTTETSVAQEETETIQETLANRQVPISNVQIKEVTFNQENGYVIVEVPNETGKITVWSQVNGKDDAVEYPLHDGKATIRLSNHSLVSGLYNVAYKNVIQSFSWKLKAPRDHIRDDLNKLKRDYERLFSSYGNKTSLYITPVDGTEFIHVNDRLYRSASAIKIFISAALHAKASRGEVDLDAIYTLKPSDIVEASMRLENNANQSYTIREYDRMMVEYSDNTATNVIIKTIGGVEAVNDEFKRLGYTKTRLERYMRIKEQVDAGLENYISAQESADLIKNIYNSTLTDTRSNSMMLDSLKNQHHNIYLRTRIQSKLEVYNKPGGAPGHGIENDITVIGKNGIYYAIAFLSNDNYGITPKINTYGEKIYETIVAYPQKQGLHQRGDGTWLYYENGRVATHFNGLTYYNGTWYYVKNGQIDWSYEGIVYYNGNYYYVRNAQITWGQNGFVTVGGKTYAIENTTVKKGYNGLVQDSDSTWYYVTDGFVDRSYSGLTYYNGTWYYVKDGQIDWSYEGIEYYNGKYYYIKNAQITWGQHGLVRVNGRMYAIENTTVRKGYNELVQATDGTWYYVTDGVVDRSYSGLTYYNGTWYYVKNGQIDWSYEGIEYYNGKYYYIKNAQITWGQNGLVSVNGRTYAIENTTVRKGYNGLVQATDGTWYYVTDGFVDRSYSGLTYYNGTWYYVTNGQIDWSYEGIEYYNGKYYYIKNAQITLGQNGQVVLDGKVYQLTNTVVTNYN